MPWLINVPKLRNIDIDLTDHTESENFDTGLIELIKKSPLTSFKSAQVDITEPVMNEFLASQLQLQEASFDIIGVSSLQLSKFFKKFSTLQSFNGGWGASDKHYDTLLQFVTDNKFLKIL